VPERTSPTAGTPETAPVGSTRVMFVGHSLVNHHVPWILRGLAEAGGASCNYKSQLLNGTALREQWHDHDKVTPVHAWDPDKSLNLELGGSALKELPTGRYDVLIMTEAVPLQDHLEPNESFKYARQFYQLAQRSRRGARVYLYETWESTGKNADWARWRRRLDEVRPLWERLAHEAAAGEQPGVQLIPAGRALAALYDRLEQGPVGALQQMKDLFADDIHLNTTGNFFVATVMYAIVFRKSPVGLGPVRAGPFPPAREEYVIRDLNTRKALQELAWHAVSSDARAGVAR
jgi:hypothetical protein